MCFPGISQRVELGDSDGHNGPGSDAGGRRRLLPARLSASRFVTCSLFHLNSFQASRSNGSESSSGLELPGINYSFNAKKYRYFYGSRVEWSPHPNKVRHLRPAAVHPTGVGTFKVTDLSPVQQLAKFDIVTRRHVEWQQENCFPSEPVFVASPGAVEEDDGERLASSFARLKTTAPSGRKGKLVPGSHGLYFPSSQG